MVDLQNEDAFQIPVQELLGDELPFVLVWLLRLLRLLLLLLLLMMMMMMMMMMMTIMTLTTYDFGAPANQHPVFSLKAWMVVGPVAALMADRPSGSLRGGPLREGFQRT